MNKNINRQGLKKLPLEIRGQIEENICRKNLTPSELIEIGKRVDKVLKISEKAKERQKSSLKKGEKKPAVQAFAQREKSQDKIASYLKWSGETHRKAKQVVDSKDKKLIEEMDKTGNVNNAYRELKRKERNKNFVIPKLPKGKFNVIYADPPWRYQFSETNTREIENQYPTMKLDEIKDLKIPSADNSILLLWATAPKIEEAISVLNAWGFTYKTCAVWDKEIIGMGYWFRGQHELLLVGIKGNFPTPIESVRTSSVYKERRTKHSKKPNYYYQLIEDYFPGGKYLELFARKKFNKKWTVWGNETP